MIEESVKELEARLSTLKHIRAFVDLNIKAREEEIKKALPGKEE